MARRVNAPHALACALVLLAQPAAAEALRDPTMPPAAILQPAEPGEQAGPVLQSVLIAGERRMAVIDGTTVSLGGRFRDARVVKVNESEVVLQRASGAQTLRLYPAVEMKPAADHSGAQPARSRGKKK